MRGNVPPQPRSRKADEQREAREAVEQREPVRPLGSQPQGEGRLTRTAPGIQPSLHHTKPSERERLAELGIRQIGQHPWSKHAERKLSAAAEAHDVRRPEAAAAGAHVRSRLAPPRSRACAPSGSRSPPLPSLAPSLTCAHHVLTPCRCYVPSRDELTSLGYYRTDGYYNTGGAPRPVPAPRSSPLAH